MYLLIVSLFLASHVPLIAASIQFEQGGWSAGGPLRVDFTGEDQDSDGLLLVSELTDFRAVWRTPSGANAVWRLEHISVIGFFYYDLQNYLFLAQSPESTLASTVWLGEAFSFVEDESFNIVARTTALPTAVPEPINVLLTGVGVLTVFLAKRKAHRF